MNQVYFTKFLAKPAQENVLFLFFQEVANYVKTLNGCIGYRVLRNDRDANVISVFEIWTDSNAHDMSLQDAKVKEFISRGMQFIDKVLSQEKFME